MLVETLYVLLGVALLVVGRLLCCYVVCFSFWLFEYYGLFV